MKYYKPCFVSLRRGLLKLPLVLCIIGVILLFIALMKYVILPIAVTVVSIVIAAVTICLITAIILLPIAILFDRKGIVKGIVKKKLI
ncbi:MAG: hypothetical protein WCY62_02190 [Clostridia bacterium]